MRAEDQFHLGIVVDDFDATLALLSSVGGYEWGAVVGGPIAVTLPTGEAEVDIRCAYSRTVPRLEVVRSVPGSLWEPVAGAGIHHVGYWSDDVAGDVAHLTGLGFVTEASRVGPDGALYFAFLRSANGFRIELVSRAAEAGLARCWAAPEPQTARSHNDGGNA